MGFNYNGLYIINESETVHKTDVRGDSPFSTSWKFLFDGMPYSSRYSSYKLASYPGNYVYSRDSTGGRYCQNGSPLQISARGCRPLPNTLRWSSSTPGTYWINRFSDGEVWVSGSHNSRSGTQISLSDNRRQYFYIQLIGAGGGGGGSNATESGGGGGAGGVGNLCFKLDANAAYQFTIGSGGGGGGGNSDGGTGGNTRLIAAANTNFSTLLIEWGGKGGAPGKSGGNGSGGGTGGSYYASYDNAYGMGLGAFNAPNGGAKDTAGGSRTTYNLSPYNPENIGWSMGGSSGGAKNFGGGGAGGFVAGTTGGKGAAAYEDGGAGGIACGGGGGAFVWFSSRAGGSGGNGYVKIFY